MTRTPALDHHRTALSACRRCDLPDDVRPIVSLARATRVMLVGQAPGKVEAGGGAPFSGRAGRTLFSWFARIGLDERTVRSRVYIAAVTRCYPGPSSTGRGDRVPGRRERERCAGWLDAELRIIRPTLVIPVGRLAIERFLGSRPLEAVVGRAHALPEFTIIPLPHPSGASSWVHAPRHGRLLDDALALIAAHWRAAAARRCVA